MTDAPKIGFAPFAAPAKGALVVFCDDALTFGPQTRKALAPSGDLVARAAKAERFTGKSGSSLTLPVPAGLKVTRLVVIGTGKPAKLTPQDFLKLGGTALSKVPVAEAQATVFAETAAGAMTAQQAADLATGARLRAYAFDRYKTKKKDDDKRPAGATLTVAVSDVAAANKALAPNAAIAEGVVIARDLVNEPANVLYPEEFARRASKLRKVGVDVDVLDVKQMRKLGMNALLGVGQGSVRDSRLVVMRWNGGKKGEKPVAFIGKGVCFDTGGLDIKPSSGMLNMKKDMGGAASVLGLAHMIMASKMKLRLRVLIPAVENSVSGRSFRPRDVYPSRKGLTVEIGNTDAEGRLVLADALALACEDKPALLADFATLTGAARVALGAQLPALFTNDDKLAADTAKAGLAENDPVWRLPLWQPYEAQLDSKVSDINNMGTDGFGGAIIAALFLKKFVDVPSWVHFDIFAWTPSARPGRPEGAELMAARALYKVLCERYG